MSFLNMKASVQIGAIVLQNISSFEINENILGLSNTAKVVIPRNFKIPEIGGNLKDAIKPGDRVAITAGYDDITALEFTGYVREINSDIPLTVHCEDESYILQQTNYIKSYRNVSLKQILTDIVPKPITFTCPDVELGKIILDNVSAFYVLQELMSKYGLYSRLFNNHLHVGLVYDFGNKAQTRHTYNLSFAPDTTYFITPIVKNELKYKREGDIKVRFKAVATNAKGVRVTATVGSSERDAMVRSRNYVGDYTEQQLREKALNELKTLVFEGYTGTVTGFGQPYTHAGDLLTLKDYNEPYREGTYLIERVSIVFSPNSGYRRKNTLGYKVDGKENQ